MFDSLRARVQYALTDNANGDTDMTRDYSITLQDSTGKTLTVNINGDTIAELIADGHSESTAVEGAEQNVFGAAINNGEIGADCWIVSINR